MIKFQRYVSIRRCNGRICPQHSARPRERHPEGSVRLCGRRRRRALRKAGRRLLFHARRDPRGGAVRREQKGVEIRRRCGARRREVFRHRGQDQEPAFPRREGDAFGGGQGRRDQAKGGGDSRATGSTTPAPIISRGSRSRGGATAGTTRRSSRPGRLSARRGTLRKACARAFSRMSPSSS